MDYKGIKSYIFDLDGVICFTDKYHYLAWKQLADEQGIYFDEEINNRLRGVSRMASLESILERSDRLYTMPEKENMAEKKNHIYREYLKQMSPKDLPSEVKSTLEELKHRGCKLAIGSSSKNTRFILERIGLADFFDAIADGTMITHSKPDPEVFLKAAELIEADPSSCIVVEDAKAGIQAAKAGGFISCALYGDARECGLEDCNLDSFENLFTFV